jgi:hypothetical protein
MNFYERPNSRQPNPSAMIRAWSVLFIGHNAGGEAAHLGGAALGFILIRRPKILNIFQRRSR